MGAAFASIIIGLIIIIGGLGYFVWLNYKEDKKGKK